MPRHRTIKPRGTPYSITCSLEKAVCSVISAWAAQASKASLYRKSLSLWRQPKYRTQRPWERPSARAVSNLCRMKARNGARPVPGPTMTMGVATSGGSRKSGLRETYTGTLAPTCETELWLCQSACQSRSHCVSPLSSSHISGLQHTG